ncbi:MAG: class I adenylate-forming enzyme family protein, partial [Pseudomonadota bacterium]
MADGTPPNWPAMSIAEANAALAMSDSPLKLADGRVRGVPMKIYVNMPDTIRQIVELAVPEYAARDFIVYEDERVTYDDMGRAISHIAHTLIDECGVKKGDRVAIAMRNYPQWPAVFFAAVSIGAIATPLNSWWTADELEYGLSDSAPRVLIVDDSILKRIDGKLPELSGIETVFVTHSEAGSEDPRVRSLDELIGSASNWGDLPQKPLPEVALDADDDATIMYTSGTTGRPKGALATHRAIISNIGNAQTCQARAFLRRGEMPPEPDPNEQRSSLLA